MWEYPYVSIHSPLFRELANRQYLLKTVDGDPYVFGWDTSPETSPFGDVLTSLPESGHRRLHQSRRLRAGGATRIERCSRPASTSSRATSASTFPTMRSRSTATRGERLHNVYPLLYNRCVYEATKKFGSQQTPPDGLGAAPAGPAASAIRSSGAAIRRATGKGLPRASAAGFRGA